MRKLLLASCLAVTALPAAAAFLAINRLYVVPISNVSFEVIESRGAGASDIWCAAADFARRAGLDGARKRMYISDPRGKSQTTPNATGVVFTVDPDDELLDTPQSYSVSVKRKGENLAISHAYNFCRVFFDDFRDRF